jgi:hypothetical protein
MLTPRLCPGDTGEQKRSVETGNTRPRRHTYDRKNNNGVHAALHTT